jgi:hypothetical protein
MTTPLHTLRKSKNLTNMITANRKLVAFLSVLTLLFSGSVVVANAATKIGATCKQPNATSTVKGVAVKCLKTGNRYTWKKVATSSTPAALPTNFSDLAANRKGISQAAWTKVNQSIAKNTSKVGTFNIHTGPNTKPYFDDYQKPVALVSKLFPTIKEPASNIVIQYKFKDLTWADAKVKELLPASEIERLNRDEGGRLLTSNCDSSQKTCFGSKQLTTTNGINLVLQGVPEQLYSSDLAGQDRFKGGMLEAHEYFHSLQRIPTQGIGIQQKDYPPVWFVEGSAEWVQNAAINNRDFNKYKNYFDLDCQATCKKLSKSDIAKILTEATNSFWPKEYEYWLNYALGSLLIESLVSITNPESIMKIYDELATRIGFTGAFKNVYGLEWSAAIPILSEAVYLNLQGK